MALSEWVGIVKIVPVEFSSDSLRVSDRRSVPRTLREFLPPIVLSSGKLLRPLRLPHYILGHGKTATFTDREFTQEGDDNRSNSTTAHDEHWREKGFAPSARI